MRITTFVKDLDDEIRTQQRLRRKAEIDALTGVLNRESILEQITKCLEKQSFEANPVLLFVDLDSFKQVNDSLGHPFGDKVLRSIAQRLKILFQRDDIVGRIGGDEFLIFLKNVPSRADAENRAKRIFETVPLHYSENGQNICVTCSVGASIYEEGKTFEQMYAEADEAMYRAKKAGKNTFVFYG